MFRARSSQSPARPAGSAGSSAGISAAEGAAIAALDIGAEAVTGFAEELGASGIKAQSAVADIGDPTAVADAFAELAAALGPVDILINNAGVSQHPSLASGPTPAGWRDDVNGNLNGAY